MSESTPERPARPDRLTALLTLVEECNAALTKLGEFQEECARQFRRMERELIAQIASLKAKLEDFLLPEAVEEEAGPAAAAGPGLSETASSPTGAVQSEGEAAESREEVPTAHHEASTSGEEQSEQSTEPESSRVPASPRTEPSGHEPPAPKPRDAGTAQQSQRRFTEEELKQLIRERYPAFIKLYAPKQAASQLLQSGTSASLPRHTLEAINTAYAGLQKKLILLLENEEVGRNALREQGRLLVNQLQELDRFLDPGQQHEHAQFLKGIRDGLWGFIEAATDKEFRVIELQAGVNISAGIRQGNYLPEDKYIEYQRVNNPKYPKDVVIRTLRPGYMRLTADRKGVDQVILKAFVQIATGSAY